MADWAVAGQQQKLQVAELALMENQAACYTAQAAEHLEELEILEADCGRFAARLGLKPEEESQDLNSSLRRLGQEVSLKSREAGEPMEESAGAGPIRVAGHLKPLKDG